MFRVNKLNRLTLEHHERGFKITQLEQEDRHIEAAHLPKIHSGFGIMQTELSFSPEKLSAKKNTEISQLPIINIVMPRRGVFNLRESKNKFYFNYVKISTLSC